MCIKSEGKTPKLSMLFEYVETFEQAAIRL